MKHKTYHIITIGCQMNVSDSERIAGYLEGLGFVWTDKREQASLVVMTTCGVRQSAEDRVYMLLPKIKKENSRVITVVTGCLSGRVEVQKRLKNIVDIWLPIVDLTKLGKMLKKFENLTPTLSLVRRGGNAGGSVSGYLKIIPKYNSNFSAFVPIGNGCNNFCAYCVVPYARGREVYRPAGEILAEARGLVKRGYKEIFLIAQNVNSYKSKVESLKSKAVNFAQLLKMVNAVPGNFWIRFATSHPKDMSDKLIQTIADCKKVCRQIHLPVQAGDNEVLRQMNRKYTCEHYLGLIKKIRRTLPDASISTDIIVGFPGETKKQFQNSEKLFRLVKFDQAFISQYSPRPGTAAAKLKDNVSKTEKKRREEALMKILRRTALTNNRLNIDSSVEVLLEGQKGDYFFGKSKLGKNVRLIYGQNRKLKAGNFVMAKIISVKDFGMQGTVEK